MKSFVLAGFTFREASRKRLVLAALLLTAVFLILFAVGTHFAVRELETSRLILPALRSVVVSQLLLMGVWVVSLASALLAIFAASGTLSGEIESFTIHAVATKPIRRWEIVLGKWMGLAVMVVVYTVVSVALVVLIVWLRAGYVPPHLLVALAALSVQSLVLLSLTILGSAFFPSLATGIGVFMVHAIAIAGGLVEQLGFVLRNQTMQDIGLWVSIVIPSDVMAKLAAAGLQTMGGGMNMAPSPFAVLSPPSVWMAAYAVLYLGICLALASGRFEQRDL